MRAGIERPEKGRKEYPLSPVGKESAASCASLGDNASERAAQSLQGGKGESDPKTHNGSGCAMPRRRRGGKGGMKGVREEGGREGARREGARREGARGCPPIHARLARVLPLRMPAGPFPLSAREDTARLGKDAALGCCLRILLEIAAGNDAAAEKRTGGGEGSPREEGVRK